MTAPQPGLSAEYAVAMRESMLQGLAREVEITKRVLAAVPDGQRDCRPDPKARSAWELAWHLVSCDVQMTDEITDQKFQMEPRFKEEPKNVRELVDWYDKNFNRAHESCPRHDSRQLTTPVDFLAFNFPAVFYLSFINNHSIHHRGQLAVYLRPMGSKVPSISGGSADEPWPG